MEEPKQERRNFAFFSSSPKEAKTPGNFSFAFFCTKKMK